MHWNKISTFRSMGMTSFFIRMGCSLEVSQEILPLEKEGKYLGILFMIKKENVRLRSSRHCSFVAAITVCGDEIGPQFVDKSFSKSVSLTYDHIMSTAVPP